MELIFNVQNHYSSSELTSTSNPGIVAYPSQCMSSLAELITHCRRGLRPSIPHEQSPEARRQRRETEAGARIENTTKGAQHSKSSPTSPSSLLAIIGFTCRADAGSPSPAAKRGSDTATGAHGWTSLPNKRNFFAPLVDKPAARGPLALCLRPLRWSKACRKYAASRLPAAQLSDLTTVSIGPLGLSQRPGCLAKPVGAGANA